MKLEKTIKNLFTPAYIYILVSAFAILFALFSGIGIFAVLIKAIFVIFWTYVLNMLCKNGYKNVSWFLVLLPYFFILLRFLQTNEGFAQPLKPKSLEKDPKPGLKSGKQPKVIAKGSSGKALTARGP
jgi:hypothetical protein